MAVCVRGSVPLLVVCGICQGFLSTFFFGGGGDMGRAVFQGGAWMITN